MENFYPLSYVTSSEVNGSGQLAQGIRLEKPLGLYPRFRLEAPLILFTISFLFFYFFYLFLYFLFFLWGSMAIIFSMASHHLGV